MGGDHKCPVCQATFTRPQHVARHMRSHTGDRPYKCQYCGDQFARSDLLSRHINKCHSNEKPPQSVPGSRRKGSASASRATTSKQACDQCVQSSLPCDGCNPCAKCIQRKCRCTFVKFHRQTAPVGPGHNPRLHPASTGISTSLSASATSSSQPHLSSGLHLHPRYAQDDLLLGPAPGPAHIHTHHGHTGAHTHTQTHSQLPDSMYAENFSFSSLYPSSSSSSYNSALGGGRADAPPPSLPLTSDPDFTDKYKAHTELLRRSGVGVERSSGPGPSTGGAEWFDQGQVGDKVQDIERHFPVFAPGAFSGPRSGYTPTGTGFTPVGFPGQASGYGAGTGSVSGFGVDPGAGPGGEGFVQGYPSGAGYGGYNVQDMRDMRNVRERERERERRRGSTDFGGGSGSASEPEGYAGSEGGASEVPPSSSSGASSVSGSSVNLPGYGSDFGMIQMHQLEQQQQQRHPHTHQRRPSSASSLGNASHHHSQQHHPQNQQQQQHPQSHVRHSGYPREGEGGFSETFGLMSLDDPAVLAGLATDAAPFFAPVGRMGSGVGGDAEDPNVTPMPHSHSQPGSHAHNIAGVNTNGARGHRSNTLPAPARDALEAEWWDTYIKRTPGTGGLGEEQDQAQAQGQGQGGRRPRVASLPSSKGPVTLPGRYFGQLVVPPPRNPPAAPGGAGHKQAHTHSQTQEDLTSYEAAVKARGAPVALSLRLPREKEKKRDASASGTGAGGKGKSASAGTSPQVQSLGYVPGSGIVKNEEMGGIGMSVGSGSRPRSAADSGTSSLANVFGNVQGQQQQQQQQRPGSAQQHVTFAPMDVTSTSTSAASPPFAHVHSAAAYRMGNSAGGASSASPSSRASSVDPGSGGSEFGGSGSMSASGSVSGAGLDVLRPSFKRLPSQTLGPVSAKRALVSQEEGQGGSEGEGYGEYRLGGRAGGGAVGIAERRRRRMSAPDGVLGGGVSEGVVGAGHELA